jgi:ADP-ribose pyrophosphatase
MIVVQAWKRVDPTREHRIGHRLIVTKTFKMPDDRTAEFETVNHEASHCIATVALTSENTVVIAEQFRPGPEKILEELPGGGVEIEDVDFEQAARRELKEETGYEAGAMTLLGNVYKDAYVNSTWHYFFATDCVRRGSDQQLDKDEFAMVKCISISHLLDNARNGRMTDVSAVFLAYDRLIKLKER